MRVTSRRQWVTRGFSGRSLGLLQQFAVARAHLAVQEVKMRMYSRQAHAEQNVTGNYSTASWRQTYLMARPDLDLALSQDVRQLEK